MSRRRGRASRPGGQVIRPGGQVIRRRLTDPLLPVLVLTPAAVLAAPVLTWAVLGGLGGYSLSGSV